MPETSASRGKFLIFTLLFGLLLALCPLWGQPRHPSALTAVVEPSGFQNLLDSVVRVDVWENDYSTGAKRTDRGVGSGVIMTKDGYILTNAHVANPEAERILVTLANLERVPARFVGWDHWTDLAVLQIDRDDLKKRGLSFTHTTFADSAKLKPGDVVFAVGTPNGLARTVTKGIISNTDRFFEGTQVGRGYETGYFNTWLQTDAAINPGNSGGPLALADGRVVGINTRGYLGANNLGFSVPSDTAKTVMARIIANGKVTRSYIGIEPAPMQDMESFFDIAIKQGTLVESLDPGSPAAEAGLKPGDIILSINGNPVDGRFPEQLPAIKNQIASLPIGSTVVLQIKRGPETLEKRIVTEPLESRVGEERVFEKWGLGVQKLTKAVAREDRLPNADGVVVIGLQDAYPADLAKLQKGDIITKVNRKPIRSVADLQAVYQGYEKTPQKLLLEILRDRETQLVVLKPAN